MAPKLLDLWRDSDGLQWFMQTCPWALLTAPAVHEVFTAHKWFDKGQLKTRYPNPGVALLRAIETYDNGLNRGQCDKIERDRKKTKI